MGGKRSGNFLVVDRLCLAGSWPFFFYGRFVKAPHHWETTDPMIILRSSDIGTWFHLSPGSEWEITVEGDLIVNVVV